MKLFGKRIPNPFARPKISHPDAPDFYAYSQGDIFTGGAETLALHRKFSDPLFNIRGGGVIPAMQFRELQPPQVVVSYTVPNSPYQGFPFGTMALQGLIDSAPQESDILESEGQV